MMRRLLAIAVFSLPAPLTAAPDYQAACAVPVAAEFVRRLDDWHAGLGERAVQALPSLREVSDLRVRMDRLQRAWQLQRLAWAAEHDPDRVELGQGIPTALAMAWSEALEAQLRSAEPDYADLRAQWRTAERAERRHPKREALQRVLRERVLNSPAYVESARTLAERVAPLNERWRACAALDRPRVQSLTE